MAENLNNLEDPEDNIIFNPNVKRDPEVDSGPGKKASETTADNEEEEDDGVVYNEAILGPEVLEDKKYDIDVSEYAGRIGSDTDDVYMPSQGVGVLDSERAKAQSWQSQLGGAVSQAVVGEMIGGTIEGVGYLLDWEGIGNLITGEEKEYANWLSDFGKGIRETTEEATRIYETNPGEMNFSDSGYWFKNSVSIASSLSMLIPSLGATKALGFIGRGASKAIGKLAKKGAKKFGKEISEKAFDLSSKMGVRADWTANGISQAVVSRHIENTMEASGTFEEIYDERITQVNPETGKLFTEEESKQLAADGASENYKHGWAMLAQDVVQYLAIGKVFNPITRQMVVAKKFAGLSKAPKWVQKTAGTVGTFASEAGEEGYQHYIASRAKLNSDLRSGLISQEEFNAQLGEVMSSDEAATSMLFGGLGGSVFQMVGPKANDILKSKSKKEFEARASETFKNSLDNRNKVYAALQIEKNKGAQEGTQEEIEMQQEDLILSMVLDGLDNDNLEMVMEAIENGPELTAEEIAKFGEENKYEWDNEVAKEGAKRALQVAKEVKEIHFRNKDKARNKNVDPAIVKSMSRIEFQNKEFSGKLAETKNKNRGLVEGLHFDGFLKPTDNYREAKEVNSRIEATKKVIRRQQAALEKSVDKDVKNDRKQLIKSHSYSLSQLKKRAKQLAKEDNEVVKSSDESAGNEMAEKIYQNASPEIEEGYARELEINDAITQNQLELVRLNDENFQKALVNKQTEAAIQNTNDLNKLETFKKQVQNGEVTGYSSSKDVEKVIQQVEAKIKSLKEEKEVEEARVEAARAKAELDKKIADKNNDPEIPGNNVVVPVKESLEDEHRYEEIWFEEQFEEKEDVVTEVNTSNGKTIALLDEGVTSAAYKQWSHDGKSKIGTKIRYGLAKRGNHRGNISKLYGKVKEMAQARLNAENDFARAIKNKTSVPQNVYDFLPLQAFIGEEDGINTFLPEKPQSDKSAIEKKRYQENYSGERKRLIDMLYNGEKPETTVKYTSGGQLQTQVDEDGVVAENNIKDLAQVKKSDEGPKLVYSNIDGDLTELDKKTNFPHKKLSVGIDENGKPMPYRGGLFLILKKADGTPFPVRMNFLKNTKEQSEVLADILIDVALPSTEEGKTGHTMSTPLSLVKPELQERIREIFKAEVEFFENNAGSKGAIGNEDPSLGELLDMFVYISEKTDGLTSQLYMKNDSLYFGNENGKIDSTNEGSERENLVEFLTEVKRRQFSLKMWNDTRSFPGYRDFVMDNKIINTNVVTFKPEFTTETAEQYEEAGGAAESGRTLRRVQIYAAPLDNKTPAKPAKVAKGAVVKPVVTSTNNLVGDQGVASNIQEQVGPTMPEINAEVKKKFKGIVYTGKGFERIDQQPISKADLKILNEIKDSLTKAQATAVDSSQESNDVETLRAEEQAELLDAIPNAEKYLTDGKVDKTKIKNKAHLVKFEKIYKKYDILISPLLPSNESDQSAKELKEKREEIIAQRDFKVERLREIDTSDEANIISKKEVDEKIREAQNMAAEQLAELESTKVDDTVISKPAKKEVPSRPARKTRLQKRSIGSGGSSRVKPSTTDVQDDSSIEKEDDKKTPDCTPGA